MLRGVARATVLEVYIRSSGVWGLHTTPLSIYSTGPKHCDDRWRRASPQLAGKRRRLAHELLAAVKRLSKESAGHTFNALVLRARPCRLAFSLRSESELSVYPAV